MTEIEVGGNKVTAYFPPALRILSVFFIVTNLRYKSNVIINYDVK
jgi:hypothetical protein